MTTREELAVLLSGALRAEGWRVPSTTAYRLADAILARPGLLRAAADACHVEVTHNAHGDCDGRRAISSPYFDPATLDSQPIEIIPGVDA